MYIALLLTKPALVELSRGDRVEGAFEVIPFLKPPFSRPFKWAGSFL
jgi:hypothetical protein